MSKPLKVGFLGAGGISRWHMSGWQASAHAEVIAASDIDEPGLQDWGKTFGVTRLTTDWRELLADPAIDIVDICTPNMLHAEQVIAALEAGKHVRSLAFREWDRLHPVGCPRLTGCGQRV